jgi:hypothetical protein
MNGDLKDVDPPASSPCTCDLNFASEEATHCFIIENRTPVTLAGRWKRRLERV